MIKGVFGIHKLKRWFKCIILDKHEDTKVPIETDLVVIEKCRYCGRTLCS